MTNENTPQPYDWKGELSSETIATLGEMEINSKTIILFAGVSLAGKTVSCLHLADDAIKKDKKVVYFDLETKPFIKRPKPNLFKYFLSKNQKKYNKLFKYYQKFDVSTFFNILKKEQPELLIIDSIYAPFLKTHQHPMIRASAIKKFIRDLREYLTDVEMGCVLTTQVIRVVDPKTKEETFRPAGGEGLKYYSDIKVFIDFSEKDESERELGGNRFFVVDKQRRYAFKIEYGGRLIPIE